jgi:hypothetical protein
VPTFIMSEWHRPFKIILCAVYGRADISSAARGSLVITVRSFAAGGRIGTEHVCKLD